MRNCGAPANDDACCATRPTWITFRRDDFQWACLPDESGLDFFLYDLSWAGFCNGQVNPEQIHAETNVEVAGLDTLRQAMEGLFSKYAGCAIAVKAQHAYSRTLNWKERNNSEAAAALEGILNGAGRRNPGTDAPMPGGLVLGPRRGTLNRAQSAVQDPHRILRRQRPHAGEPYCRRKYVRAIRALSGRPFCPDAYRLSV